MSKRIILSLLCFLLVLPGAGLANTGQQSNGTSVEVTTTTAGDSQADTPADSAVEADTQAAVDPAADGQPAQQEDNNQTGILVNEGPGQPVPPPVPSGDTTQPVIESFDVSTATANVGDTVNFTAKVTDESSAINWVQVNIGIGPEFNRSVSLSFDADSNLWTGSYTVTKNDLDGTYDISVLAQDSAWNTAYYTPEGKTLTIVNPDGDFAAPVLDSAEITPATAKVGDQVTLKVKAHDEKSEIANIRASFNNPDGWSNETIELSYDQTNDLWVGSYTFGLNDQPGVWTAEVRLEDEAGNWDYQTPANAKVTFENTEGDFTAPVVNSVELSADSIKAGEKVTITADVSDDKSGVREVFAYLYNDQGDYNRINLKYNSDTNKWTGSYKTVSSTKPGEWRVYINAYDKFDNEGGTEEAYYFTIENESGDYTAPVINNVEISATEVNAGEQITLTADIEDAESGVAWVYAYSYFLGDIIFKKNADTGKWTATATVPTDIPDGEEDSVYRIAAYDMNGNKAELYPDLTYLVHNPDGDYDWDAPAVDLESLDISKKDVKPGDQIQFKVKVSDDSYILDVSGSLSSMEMDMSKNIHFAYDEEADVWVAHYTVGQYDKSGDYQLRLYVIDTNYNMDMIDTEQSISITNPNNDLQKPVIEKIEVTPTTVKAGEKLTISATVKDNESGVKMVDAYVSSNVQFEGEIYIPLTYDAKTGKWVGTVTLSERDTDGYWRYQVSAYDKFMNESYKWGYFNYNNPDGDSEKPYLDDFNVSSVTAQVGDKVTFEAKLSDGKSGVQSANIELHKEDSNNFVIIPLTYNQDKDVWSVTYTVPAYMTNGAHDISVTAKDKAGNTLEQNTGRTLIVFNDHPDQDDPFIVDSAVSTDEAAVGEKVQIKVKLKDTTSSVRNATAHLYYLDDEDDYYYYYHNRTVELTYDASQDAWVGYYTVQPGDLLGTYSVDVNAEDMVGNYIYEELGQNVTFVAAKADTTAPAKPAVDKVTDKQTTVTGKTEAGATVTVKAGSTVLGTAVAAADGKYSVKIAAQAAGTKLTITAADKAGNVSEAATATVVAASGWVESDGQWTYYDPSTSKAKTGWFNDNGTWYYFNNNGVMVTGWVQSGSTWYYLKDSGAMASGWANDGKNWYYFKASGAMVTGWVQSGSTWYYLKASGAMATGWLQSGSTWYYFKDNGVMATGWAQDGQDWYYFKASGAMATGWVQSGSTWYYLKASGAMATGWVQSGSYWYFMQDNGAMATGWVQDGSTWYFLWSNGTMATGWLWNGGVWYYLNAIGAMVTGQATIGGTAYTFNNNGALQ